jgi:hypothetical protein
MLAPHEADYMVRKRAKWRDAKNLMLHMFVPSMAPTQTDLFAEAKVIIGYYKGAKVSSLTSMHAQLSVFGMSLFYDNAAERSAVERFLCLLPRPLGDADGQLWDALRDAGIIDDNKFVHPASTLKLLTSNAAKNMGLKSFLKKSWAPAAAYELAIRSGSDTTNLDLLNGGFGFQRSPLLFLKYLTGLRQVSHQVKRTHYAALMN